MRACASYFLLTLTGLLPVRSALGESPPKDHPIHAVPDFLLAGARQAAEIYRSDIVFPKWEFSLAKGEYRAGEVIWATVRIQNPSPKRSFRFSPPYVGQNVATVGVWRSRWEEKEGKGEWGEVRDVFRINRGRGRYRPPLGQFQGKPVVLAPGQTADFVSPVNVSQPGEPTGPSTGFCNVNDALWEPGIGFMAPGKYRVYLQYLNLEARMPFEHRNSARDMALRAQLRQDDPVRLPFRPVVLGPAEVEIRKRKTPESTRAVRLLESWQDSHFEYLRGRTHEPLFLDGSLPTAVASLTADDADLRASLTLSAIRARFMKLRFDGHADAEALAGLLRESQAVRKQLAEDPLTDAFRLTECYLLRALGRSGEALKLALQIATPDTAVFVEDEKEAEQTKDRKAPRSEPK